MADRFRAHALSHLVTKALALLMLAAIASPYAHAALEITEHEQCGMESCKRAGKCCCKRSTPGKLHWDGKDICHHGFSQQPAVTSPATAPEPLAIFTVHSSTTSRLDSIFGARANAVLGAT